MQLGVAERADLTREWLRIYAGDEGFREQLLQLAVQHAITIQHLLDRSDDANTWPILRVSNQHASLLTAFAAALVDFTAEWQLHLLPKRRGIQAVHTFCLEHIRIEIGPQQFAELYAFDYNDWPTDLDIDDFTIDWFMSPEKILNLGIAMWDPTTERPTDARARIRAEVERRIDAELERIIREHEQAGYAFAKTRSEHQKYLQWLYWKLVQGKSNDEIAELAGPPDDVEDINDHRYINENTVINKTKIVADLLGIAVPRRRQPPT
jgi:hypothetical protein